MNATIEVHNAAQRVNGQWVKYTPGDDIIKGKYGGSLKVGYHKDDDSWDNYFVNDEKLFTYFAKGATLNVEYKMGGKQKDLMVITGVGPTDGSQAAVGDSSPVSGEARNRSIELQNIAKAWGQVQQGNKDLPAAVFAADVITIHELMFVLAKQKEEVAEKLGKDDEPEVAKEDEPEEEDFGF